VINAETIARQRGGACRSGDGWVCRCPVHDDRHASLSVRDGKDGRVLVKCHAGCKQQRVIDALRAFELWPHRFENASRLTESEQERQRKQEAARERKRARRAAFMDWIWQQAWRGASPARGSPIERWLQARGINLHPDELDRMPIRWAPRCPLGDGAAPAMIARMTDPITAEPIGLHRTFLLTDGTAKAPVPQPRMMLGKAGIIRLSPDEGVSLGVGICEGVETGLSIAAAGWSPIWVAGSLNMLTRFPVLSGIECLTIFSDAKAHEVDGARACAARWAAAGREAVVWIPPAVGDWNFALGRGA
jgi:Toprim domain